LWRSSPGQQQLSLQSGMTIGMDVLLTRHLNLRTLVGGSIYDIPFADRSFDLVTCKVVMEHLDEPARAVAEIARVLVRGGALIINPPNLWNYGRVLANAISAKVLPERWRLSLVRASDSREPQDIFPVRYPREYPTSAERNVYGHWLRVHRAMVLPQQRAFFRATAPVEKLLMMLTPGVRPLIYPTRAQLTVSVAVPFAPFMVAVMVVVPVPAGLANPSGLMVATVASEDVQVT
jgi:SAM-dependent methyltransferase